MTNQTHTRKLKAITKHLRAAQALAESVDFTLANGALLDCLIGSLADDLDTLMLLEVGAK